MLLLWCLLIKTNALTYSCLVQSVLNLKKNHNFFRIEIQSYYYQQMCIFQQLSSDIFTPTFPENQLRIATFIGDCHHLPIEEFYLNLHINFIKHKYLFYKTIKWYAHQSNPIEIWMLCKIKFSYSNTNKTPIDFVEILFFLKLLIVFDEFN